MAMAWPEPAEDETLGAEWHEAGPSQNGGPVGRMQAALATALNDDPEWKEF